MPDDIRGKYRTPRKSMTMSIRSKNTVKTMHAPGPRYQRRNERTAAQQHCPLTIRAPVRFALEPPRLHNFYRYASLCNVCGVVLIVSPSDKMPCEARMQMRCYFSFLLGQQVALVTLKLVVGQGRVNGEGRYGRTKPCRSFFFFRAEIYRPSCDNKSWQWFKTSHTEEGAAAPCWTNRPVKLLFS